jgi:hypothetical protein
MAPPRAVNGPPCGSAKNDREGQPLPDVLTLSPDIKKGNPIQVAQPTPNPDDADQSLRAHPK